MAINQNSQISTYPGTVSEKGSAKTNARTDVTTIGEIAEYMRIPENEGGGGLLPVPGNLGNSVDISANMALVQTLVTLGFDMSRVQFPNETLFPRIFDYSNSKFSRAKFVGADMDCSVVEGEESNAGSFEEADLSLAVFAGATIKNVNFSGCSLPYAVFSNTTINECVFDGSNLNSANLDESNFGDSCTMNGCDLTNVMFSSVTAFGITEIEQCGLIGASFNGVEFTGGEVSLIESAGSGTTFIASLFPSGLDMRDSSFSDSSFTGAQFGASTNFSDSMFSKCSFAEAAFADFDCQGALFESCNFLACAFNGTQNPVGASFIGSEFDSPEVSVVFPLASADPAIGEGDTLTWIDGTTKTFQVGNGWG